MGVGSLPRYLMILPVHKFLDDEWACVIAWFRAYPTVKLNVLLVISHLNMCMQFAVRYKFFSLIVV